MEISANEFFVLIVLAVFCWKIKQAVDDADQQSEQHPRSLTRPSYGGGGDEASASRARSTSGPDEMAGGGGAGRPHDIEQDDRSFDTKWFIENANLAYEQVITAFAQGDRKVLRTLLADDVYETFIHEIEDCESRHERVELTFICLKRSEIIETNVFDGQMQIVVSFDSDLVMVTRNAAGFVVAGEPTQVINASDLWTFVNESPASPIWKLARTESPAEKERCATDDRVLQLSGV